MYFSKGSIISILNVCKAIHCSDNLIMYQVLYFLTMIYGPSLLILGPSVSNMRHLVRTMSVCFPVQRKQIIFTQVFEWTSGGRNQFQNWVLSLLRFWNDTIALSATFGSDLSHVSAQNVISSAATCLLRCLIVVTYEVKAKTEYKGEGVAEGLWM